MGTPHKEENTTESIPISDCNMEAKEDEQFIHPEHLPAKEDPMVNSSETSLLQDASIVNSDLTDSVSDSSFLNESQNESSHESRLSNDTIKDDSKFESKVTEKSDEEKSNVSSANISESSDYTKYCDNILNKDSGMPVEVSPSLSDEISKSSVLSVESQDENKNDSDKETCDADFDKTQSSVSADTNIVIRDANMEDLIEQNDEKDVSEEEINISKTDIDINTEDDVVIKSSEESLPSMSDKEIDEKEECPSNSDQILFSPSAGFLEKSESASEFEIAMEDKVSGDANTLCDDHKFEITVEEEITSHTNIVCDDDHKSEMTSKSNDISELPVIETSEINKNNDISESAVETSEMVSKSSDISESHIIETSEIVSKSYDISELPVNETSDMTSKSHDISELPVNETSEMTNKSSGISDLIVIGTPEKSALECVETENGKEKINSDSNKLTGICETTDVKQDSHLPCSESPDSLLAENNSVEKRKSACKQESKKCPKIKISFMKKSGDSPDSLKNWFVSESEKGNETSNSGHRETLATSSDSDDNTSSKLKLSDSDAKANSSTCKVKENDPVSVTSDSKQLSTTTEIPEMNSSEQCIKAKPEIKKRGRPPKSHKISNHLSSENTENLSVNNTSDMSVMSIDENQTHHSKTPPGDFNTNEKDNSILDKNSPSSLSETSQNDSSVNDSRIVFDDSIVIKEEPMDIDETPEMNSKEQCIKTKLEIKKRGRPPKLHNKSKLLKKSVSNEIMAAVPNIKVKEEKVDSENAKNIAEEITTPATPQSQGRKKKKASLGSTSTLGASSGRKKNYDPELVCVPFSLGWMREHVIRAGGKDGKRMSDIYYFAPDGKKLRSMPEISNYLDKHPDIKLTLVNFTFAKELIYREPFEIERDARQTLKGATPVKKTPVKPSSCNKNKISVKLEKGVSPKLGANKPCDNLTSIQVSSDSVTISSLKDDNKQDQSLSNGSPSTLKKKAKKLRCSSFKEAVGSKTENEISSVKDSRNSITSKQKTLDSNYVSNANDQSEKKHFRPSRKIVKKVPFDNSFENMFPKTPKRDYSGRLLRNTKSGIKSEIKSNDYPETKLPSAGKDVPSPENQLLDSSSSIVTNGGKPAVDKPFTISNPVNISNELLLERTNIKSPAIQNKLKVKFARKTDL